MGWTCWTTSTQLGNFSLSRNAESWGINDTEVGALGTSSGGHLAMLLAFSNPSNFTFVQNMYGPGDFSEWFESGWVASGTSGREFTCHNQGDHWSFVPPSCDDNGVGSVSPVALIGPESPRTVSIHGSMDSLIPYYLSESLHDTLDSNAVRNSLITLNGFDHVLDLGYGSVGNQLCRYSLLQLLNNQKIEGRGGGDVVLAFSLLGCLWGAGLTVRSFQLARRGYKVDRRT